MRRHHHVVRPLPAAFHDVDFGRPAAVIGKHPERRPHADADRYFGADFEIAVFLREHALRGQDAGDVFVVEQRRLQVRRRAGGDDREHAVANPERIEPQRRRALSGIARIDIDLLFAIPARLTLEVGAGAAPVARIRPGGSSGIMRHPFSARQRMLVEIVVKGPVQRRHGKKSLRGPDAPALLGGRIARDRQDKFCRSDGFSLLRERRRQRDETPDDDRNFRRHVVHLRWLGDRRPFNRLRCRRTSLRVMPACPLRRAAASLLRAPAFNPATTSM